MNAESGPEAAPGRRLLVTGGSGFIGTNVVDAFLRDGHVVLNADTTPPRTAALLSTWHEVDILDPVALQNAFTSFRPDLVIHLAAKTVLNERTDLEHYAANIQGVQNVIEAVQASGGVERTFFASSRLVFRLGHIPKDDLDYNPSTLYGLSKVRGEQLVRAAGPSLGTWTIVRPTGIWGPWFGVPYRDFFRSIERGRYVHPRGRDARKSYGYVENTVHQLQRLGGRQSRGRCIGRTLLPGRLYASALCPIMGHPDPGGHWRAAHPLRAHPGPEGCGARRRRTPASGSETSSVDQLSAEQSHLRHAL